MKKNKTYQNEFKQMFEKGRDVKDLVLIIDRVNQIKLDEFTSRAVVIDTFKIDSSKKSINPNQKQVTKSGIDLNRLSHYFKYRDSKYIQFEIPKSSVICA